MDGVGTRLRPRPARGAARRRSDLAAHCVNDALVQGAEPLFFLDYFAAASSTATVFEEVVTGAADACKALGIALLGGETAEMPGVYADGGVSISPHTASARDPRPARGRIESRAGDVVLGLPSSGLRANGFSLVRGLVGEGDFDADLLLDFRGLDDVGARRRPCPRARPRHRRRASRRTSRACSDASRIDRRRRVYSPGSTSRAWMRRSSGASSTSGSATARSCRPRTLPRPAGRDRQRRGAGGRRRHLRGDVMSILVSGEGTNLQALLDARLPGYRGGLECRGRAGAETGRAGRGRGGGVGAGRLRRPRRARRRDGRLARRTGDRAGGSRPHASPDARVPRPAVRRGHERPPSCPPSPACAPSRRRSRPGSL